MDIKNDKDHPDNSAKKSLEVTSRNHKYWIGGYMVCTLCCIIIYFLIRQKVFGILKGEYLLLQRIALGAFFSFVVLIAGRAAEMFVVKQSHSKVSRYNLIRMIRLLTAIFIGVVIISFLFQNWYTAAVSLGIISLILGFALQVPISSFIAWLYIIFRTPYRVGDRIEITQFKGDVVEIGYLDTTLWEFGGDYLTNDLPSGRLIRFPNSIVLQSAVFNYSWPKFPYIWNEIPFHIAYNSDLQFVENTLREATKAELSPEVSGRIEELKNLVKQTPVDEWEIKEYPYVSFRINANTWVEATVTYLVEPKKASSTRSHIIKHAIASLLKAPEKVLFPKGDSR